MLEENLYCDKTLQKWNKLEDKYDNTAKDTKV